DHLAAFVAQNGSAAASSLLVSSGPTMFLDSTKDANRATQDLWKAEAISASLGEMGLTAFTPGYNDWAFGHETLVTLAKGTRGNLVAANLEPTEGVSKTAVRDIDGIRVGVVGVALPEMDGAPPAGV